MKLEEMFATRADRLKASEIRELLKLLDQPDIISFAGGIPDPALFPAEAFQAAYTRALDAQHQAKALQYSVSEGYLPLREWLADHMASIGVPCDVDNILITSGSQQALDYLGKLMLSPGDTALVNWPTYLGALAAFNAYEPRFDRLDLGVNHDVSDYAERAEAAGGRVKFAYLSADFSNPTGETVDAAGRVRLLDMADTLDCAIIEDGAYQALRYDGQAIKPILAMELDQKGDLEACRTIYCGSFSKTLSPGLRVGWIVAAKPVIAKLVLMKQAADLHSPTINQMAIHGVAEACFYEHVSNLRAAYSARRDAMLAALADHMPEGVEWTRPEGGMFVWITLPKGMDGATLLDRAVREERVAFVPGGAFFADGSGTNTIRLSFSNSDKTAIDEGVARLGAVLRRSLSD
ncbi:PLP-dependent aminotransferase family protein [Tropicibacter sp. R16_0]|uniref:aminotransferase-like domain-containing protein n=1 Tax=Tropicibacter sp. R16_0 TaxID=2821102 RepID=UPI001AD99C31|nr:PLP-dependent aminotransferase family protein [Tropicibacter sp. R16_0]MBO9452628.1 PLP-dependent aminotransferase family protein [Tropicibacter sp. R16_0]